MNISSNSLEILRWNCRGLLNPGKVDRIKKHLMDLKPHILCLVETRADLDRVWKSCHKFAKLFEWATAPTHGWLGGIIILWAKTIGLVTLVSTCKFSFHLVISCIKPKHWIISIVYNSQSLHVQKVVWLNLSRFTDLNLLWILAGDFNAITIDS